jgi:signal transduction histidine kinase
MALRSSPIRVLLVEGSSDDTQLLKRALASTRSTYNVSLVKSLHEAEQELGNGKYDVVITDFSLPDSDLKLTVFRLCKSAYGTPVIALTDVAPDQFALTVLEQGAQDFLHKDEITPKVLERSIQYAIQRNRNRREIEDLLWEVQQSRQLLEKKNRRLAKLYKTSRQFVGNVSHEFRTPLTVIREYTDLLREGVLGPLNEEQCRYLDVVVDRADDLNRMVDDLLDVSKVEAGLLGVWRKSCQVRDIVDYHAPPLTRKANLKGVRLEFEVPDDLPAVYCDAEKVGRVIVNLAVNAIKYCGELGVVKVWAREDDQSRGVVVGVTDNGPGIDPKCQRSIFGRYKQLGTDRRSGIKGVGLGLSIAQELVDLNFGQMRLESQVGQGSTFFFTLPPDEPQEVIGRYLLRMRQPQHEGAYVSFVRATVSESCDSTLMDEVDSFLNYLLRKHDLLFRRSTKEWLLIVPEPESELTLLFDRIAEQREEANRNRPNGMLPDLDLRPLGTWTANTDVIVILNNLGQATCRRELMA